MTSINPINVNTQGVGSSYGYTTKSKSDSKETEENEQAAVNNQQSSLSADDVLSYMAQSAVSSTATTATKTIDTSKYVDDASASRIAGFMSDFEDKVAEGLANFDKEFSGVNVSDSAKMAVVLASIDNQA